MLEDSVGSLSIFARLSHCTLGPGELGGRNNLHGLGDLLNVTNRLQSVLDFTESCEGGGILSNRPIDPKQLVSILMLSHSHPISHL